MLIPPENLLLKSEQRNNSQLSEISVPKKKRVTSPPESLAVLQGPDDLQNYNLEALKKIARMGAVVLPKAAPRAVCIERLTLELFGHATTTVNRVEDEEDVHLVNISCRA